MTATSSETERDLVIPHYIVRLLRSRVAAQQAVVDERRTLVAAPDWAANHWGEYEAICRREEAATVDLACLARLLLEQHDKTSGHPA